ncbi:hypothetical protein ABT024_20650 [Streptomyces sp. NPDC002812]|uniref:hypothetical protein n=1 Tax=Streptomyces sp. NPDC002812 TaxID=3154434 RepID=UPI00332DBF2F
MPGEELLRMGSARDESSRGWVRLSAETSEASFDPAALARMTELLRDFSQEVDPSYAQVGYSLSLGRTEHEERVGPPLPSMTLPQSRRLLRGYEWLMVIPREISARLGGGDGIALAGDFHRVETCATARYCSRSRRSSTASPARRSSGRGGCCAPL